MFENETTPPLLNVQPEAKLHLESPHTFYGEPIASPITSDITSQCESAQFEEKYYYINNTWRTITIVKRDGLCMSIGHTASQSSRDFTIRRMIKLKSTALVTTLAHLMQVNQSDSCDLAEIKKCLLHVDSGRFSEASIMLDYTVTLEDLKARGDTIYHQLIDTVISLEDIHKVDPHPYSTRFLNIGSFGQTQRYDDQKELNLKIRLVDHSNVATPRYLSFANKVFKLLPQKDAPFRRIVGSALGKAVEKNHSDYVQVFFSAKNDMSSVGGTGVGCVTMSLEEARDTMGLCDNLHDATNPARLDAERKREIIQMTHSLEIIKGENMRDRAQHEREDVERKDLLAKQTHELEVAKMATAKQKQEAEAAAALAQIELAAAKQAQAKLDADLQRLDNEKKILDMQRKTQDETLERERKEFEERAKRLREDNESRIRNDGLYWKEFYEMRSMQRKDTSDFMKFIPGLVIGLGGIAAVYIKLSPPAKPA